MLIQSNYKVKDGQTYFYRIDHNKDIGITFIHVTDPREKTVLVYDKEVGMKAIGTNALEVLAYLVQRYR